ncbi:MAG: 30S ribosomal protein S16 [Candidatus Staskawiczbacteria bacterium]|nr:30S ribosomal protein S16 [Candidatus Staskawiczbacteria bacterium]MBI3337377.1 30S ribosomal protein S16 [Candidatus Staskawiczbacteria bacterium]
MLTIRLTRKGKKNQPFFKVIVIDKRRSSRGGRAVEVLGYIDPLTKKKKLEKERILYWLKCGAKPSATINNLLIREKIIEGKKIHVSKLKKSKLAKMAAEKATAEKAVEIPSATTPEPAPVAEATANSGVPSEGGKKLIEAPVEEQKQ